jgi:uncharacterized membrane protein
MHTLNIIIHVLAGILAMISGLLAITVVKGGTKHRQAGNFFLKAISIVIITGLFGVIIYQRNTFLLIITLLSGYNAFSGFRVLKLRDRKPLFFDYVVPVMVLAAGAYYLYYIKSIGLYWSPVIIYSTLSALVIVTLYDLCKVFVSVNKLAKTATYEHIYKMTSALTGITSAFLGTVLPQFHPYSQILPSVISLIYIIIKFITYRFKQRSQNFHSV